MLKKLDFNSVYSFHGLTSRSGPGLKIVIIIIIIIFFLGLSVGISYILLGKFMSFA